MFPGQTCALLLPILERFEHSFYFRASLCILYIRAQLLSSSSSRHLHAHPNNFGQHPNHLLPTPVYTPVPMPMPMPMQILMRIPIIIIIVIIIIIFISDGSILAGTNQMTCLLCSLHWITHYHSYIPFVPVCSQVLDTASLSCESPLSTFVLGQLALFSTTDVNGKATTTHTHKYVCLSPSIQIQEVQQPHWVYFSDSWVLKPWQEKLDNLFFKAQEPFVTFVKGSTWVSDLQITVDSSCFSALRSELETWWRSQHVCRENWQKPNLIPEMLNNCFRHSLKWPCCCLPTKRLARAFALQPDLMKSYKVMRKTKAFLLPRSQCTTGSHWFL